MTISWRAAAPDSSRPSTLHANGSIDRRGDDVVQAENESLFAVFSLSVHGLQGVQDQVGDHSSQLIDVGVQLRKLFVERAFDHAGKRGPFERGVE